MYYNEWIKVSTKEKLPEKYKKCFCLLKNGSLIIAESRGANFWCSDNKWLYNYYDLDYYMIIKIPELPNKTTIN